MKRATTLALLTCGALSGCRALPQHLFSQAITPAPEAAQSAEQRMLQLRRLQGGVCGGVMQEMGSIAGNCCG
jgi:hypothetical protein